MSQQSSCIVSPDGRDIESLFISDFFSTPSMEIIYSSSANKKNETEPGSEYNAGKGIEELHLYRSISLGPRLCYQDRVCVDTSLMAVDGDVTYPQLREVQSFPSLSYHDGDRDKKVHFRSDSSHVAKLLVATIKHIAEDLAPEKRQPKIANEKIFVVSPSNSSIASMAQNGDGRDDNSMKPPNADVSSDVGNALDSMASFSQLEPSGKPILEGSEALLSTCTIESIDTDYHITVSEMDTMSSSPRPFSSPIYRDSPLPSLRRQQPKLSLGLDDLQDRSMFSSSNFGSIVSAGQSTTVSCAESNHSNVAESRSSSVSSKLSATSSRLNATSSRLSATSSSKNMACNTHEDPIW